MITKERFISLVGQRFWKHIHKETELPFVDKIPARSVFLAGLFEKIINMTYAPSPPRGFIVSHKENLVVRFIPALTREDYCVYFFCVKSLEKEIAQNRVEGTYGGWRLGWKIRKIEDFDESEYIPDSSYNRFAWKQAWTDYQKKAFNFYKRRQDLNYFIVFDIANYYDSIRLDRLETITREAVDKTKTQEVNLLFYFLSHWNKKYLHYEKQSVGLPQDEVGDCSRILANFYLQNYDQYIYKLVTTKKSGYLRYADDQIIASSNEKTAKEIMFLASQELAKIGLNLNASKAKFFTRDEFFQYWSFDTLKLLEKKDDIEKIEQAFAIFKEKFSNKNKIKFKPETILKRLLNCDIKKLKRSFYKEIMKLVRKEDFITNMNSYYIGRIYNLLRLRERAIFIKYLNDLSEKILFNQYHFRVLKFARQREISDKKFSKVICNLKRINELGG